MLFLGDKDYRERVNAPRNRTLHTNKKYQDKQKTELYRSGARSYLQGNSGIERQLLDNLLSCSIRPSLTSTTRNEIERRESL